MLMAALVIRVSGVIVVIHEIDLMITDSEDEDFAIYFVRVGDLLIITISYRIVSAP